MKVLGFDVETTGLDTASEFIIEVGAVLFDVDADGVWTPLKVESRLIYEQSYPQLSELIEGLTGITDKNLKSGGIGFIKAMGIVDELAMQAELVCAHNAQFDFAMLDSQAKRFKVGLHMLEMSWICSINDLESNASKTCKRLSHLALDYGVVVDPNVLHRAADDVTLMGRMLTAAKADAWKMHIYAETPEVTFIAQVPGPWVDGGKGTAAAKAVGYRFDPADKKWKKKVKETKAHEEQSRLFKTERI